MQSASTAKLLRLAFVLLVGFSFLAICVFKIGQVGSSTEIRDGNSSVSAGSDPVILVWTAIAIALFVVLMFRNTKTVIAGVPKWWRRVAAFCIDFWFSLLALSSVVAFIPLGLEAARTGHFMWHFQRRYIVRSDFLVGLPVVLVAMAMQFLYFAFPLTKGKETVGCFIMRIKVTPPFGEEGCFTLRAALMRTFYSIRGLGSFLQRGSDRDAQGRTWWDRKTNSTVVLIEDAKNGIDE